MRLQLGCDSNDEFWKLWITEWVSEWVSENVTTREATASKNLSLWQMWHFLIRNWLSKESQICGYNAIHNNGQSQLDLIVINVYTQQKPKA